MAKVYVVEYEANDDYEFPEDWFHVQGIDSVYDTREAANSYINSLKGYTVVGEYYPFERVEKTQHGGRCYVCANYHGMGEHLYVSFDVHEMEVRS